MALPPTATACVGLVDLDPGEEVVDAVADLADLRRRGRVGGDQLVGQHAGADTPGADLPHAAGDGAENDLGGAAADVDDAEQSVDGMAERLGRADEGEPPLLLLGEDLDRDAGVSADLLGDGGTVARFAHRGGRHGADRLRPELARQANLGRHDLPHLVRLLGRNRPRIPDRLVDPRIGPLLHQLPQLPIARLRHEQARGIGSNIYGGAEHPGTLSEVSQTARISTCDYQEMRLSRSVDRAWGGIKASTESERGIQPLGVRAMSPIRSSAFKSLLRDLSVLPA